MKTAVSLVAVLFQAYCATSGLSAQDRQEMAEPEVNDQFFFFVSAGQLKPLEQQAFPAGRSAVRFVEGEPLAFVVRLTSEKADPAGAVQFLRLKPREKDKTRAGAVPFDVEKYAESSVKIKPRSRLGPGDYALSLTGHKDVYCFGVDAPSKVLK